MKAAEKNNPTYLGDGVYAELERGMIKLTTHDPIGDQTIYLEESVAAALIQYLLQIGWLSQIIANRNDS